MQGDETITRIRAIVQEKDKLKRQLAKLDDEMRDLLDLNSGTRKPARKMLTREHGEALFAAAKRRAENERCSTQ